LPAKGRIVLILGGARSGKSTYAQHLAEKTSSKVLFVATAQPMDEEMQKRIENHRNNRPVNWRTIETPRYIVQALKEQIGDAHVVILDCVTLLVANFLGDAPDDQAEREVFAEIDNLVDYMKASKRIYIIVSNELGLGLVPENKLARIFRDLLGTVNQIIAQNADEVCFLAAGIPLKIKNNNK
jgi:adenosylcobinamide kinase/adenosylcobinamide-phosphate guanylyltransferase